MAAEDRMTQHGEWHTDNKNKDCECQNQSFVSGNKPSRIDSCRHTVYMFGWVYSLNRWCNECNCAFPFGNRLLFWSLNSRKKSFTPFPSHSHLHTHQQDRKQFSSSSQHLAAVTQFPVHTQVVSCITNLLLQTSCVNLQMWQQGDSDTSGWRELRAE